ncbi:MAG: VWA domain-containing protein [bacterium]|nr:VWA domain-containing protein [bacterium]
MKRKILALLLSLAMLLSVGGMVEGTLAVGISVDSTRSSVTLGEVDPVVTPTPEAEPTVEPEVTPEGTPEPTVEPEATPEATPAPTVEPEATPEATPAPEGEAEHIEGCSDDCTAEGCACPCHAAQKTPEEDFASMTDEELYAYVKQLSTDEEIEAFLKQLPEERLNALVAYAQAQEPVVVPETVVFTDAGPFMPPVTVERVLRRYAARAAAEEPADNGNGLELSKTATANDDRTYTIRMEAYTTGKVITSTKTVPVDIVLVLDQSGSMAYDFDGNSTNTNANRRQYAMKQAVNNFIAAVKEKYDAKDADHRMAIVTFGDNASTLQGWTNVDDKGTTELQGKINGLPNSPSGATNVAAGMEQAKTLMGKGYSYTGTNTQRQKVVIVFTDGVPTTGTDFDTTVATNAIASAKNLKDDGATVYTIGIFSGANPDELYGASGFDTNSDGTVGSQWIKDTWGLFPGTDFPEADRPAGNRFLNYLSSNFPKATSIGLTRSTRGLGILHYKITYTITDNYSGTASDYYLTANDTNSLNTIFQTISENIQSANIDLGSQTVVKDTVSPYFDLPANASVKLYTAAAKADGTFENEEPNPQGVTAEVKDGAVSVTGFDFNDNFVSDKVKEDGTYGKKLIIEFNVTPKDGFIGGKDVPTNDWQNTAVYDKDGKEVEKFADANTTPTVNVTIDDVTVTAADKNVYLLGGLTAAQLKEGATVTVGSVPLDLSSTATNYGLKTWQTAYVDITVKVKDKDGNAISDKLENLTEDTTYTVEVTVAPKTAGTSTPEKGDAATAKTGANSPASKINVFKPELTFKDSEVYYGADAPAKAEYDENNLIGTVWKHGETLSTAEGVTMIGDVPELTLGYTPDSTKIADDKINTKQDIAVDVAVKINGTDVATYTTFQHTNCAGKTCTVPTGKEFLLHVKTCTLTITKKDGAANEPYVFTVNKDGEKYTEVTIVGNRSVTIYELPVGTYTIAEDTGWSWRFTPTISSDVALNAKTPTGEITCTNTLNEPYWLNGFSAVVKNIFGTASTVNN